MAFNIWIIERRLSNFISSFQFGISELFASFLAHEKEHSLHIKYFIQYIKMKSPLHSKSVVNYLYIYWKWKKYVSYAYRKFRHIIYLSILDEQNYAILMNDWKARYFLVLNDEIPWMHITAELPIGALPVLLTICRLLPIHSFPNI